MTSQLLTNVTSAEQMMLSKMAAMQSKVQPEHVIRPQLMQGQLMVQPMSFSTTLNRVLNVVNRHQAVASKKITAVELGESDDLVGAMIASQKASLSFDGLMHVRNKLVTSFEDVMKMPV